MGVSVEKEAVESFLSGKLAQVDVKAIQDELKNLWRQAAESTSDQAEVVRACACNLILFTESEEAEIKDANLLDELVLRHPSRAILAISRPNKEKRLEAWITARCHASGGSATKQICSEQITVCAEGSDDKELLSVIQLLLIGDLPIFLWWTLDDIIYERIQAFASCVQRLIIDSQKVSYNRSYFREVLFLANSTAVSDLNWLRLFGMRKVLAEEFEKKPLNLADLKKIKTVKIRTSKAASQSFSIQSLLLLGWLSSRLGWEILSHVTNEKPELAFQSDNQIIDVQFSSYAIENVTGDNVVEFNLLLDDGRSVNITRNPSNLWGAFIFSVKDKDQLMREIEVDDDNDELLLVNHELEDINMDLQFIEALKKADEISRLVVAPTGL